MATSTFQEVDVETLSTILWDYNDPTGANNPGSVKTSMGVGGVLNLNAPAVSIDTSDRNGDGVPDLSFSYDEIVQSSFKMRAQATSYDNLRTGIGALQRILSSDGVIRWVPAGSANTYYIYRKPSSIPSLFSGTEVELYNVLQRFDTPAGVTININRERLLRGPTLLASVNQLRNATMLIATPAIASAMSNWAWDSTSNITTSGYGANVNWGTQSYRFTIATTGTRNFQQATAVASATPGDIWTFSFYVKAAGGALCKAQAVVEFLNSVGATLATATGTLTTLGNGADFVRVSVTTSAAPASTDHVRVSIRFANGDATTYTVDMRRAQAEKASSASQFRAGSGDTIRHVFSSSPYKTLLLYNPGDADALTRIAITPSSGASTVAYLLARRSEDLKVNLAEAINPLDATPTRRTSILLTSATMYGGASGDTSSQADAAASSGNAAKTTFANQASLVRRWRWVSTPTDTAALHGRWRVYCAMRGEASSTFRVAMHWQAANRDPVSNVEDVISLDTTDVDDSQYFPLRLGTVEFDATAGDAALVIEGWASLDSGAGALWWDSVYLLPADDSLGDQQTLLQVPGFRDGDQSTETWLGSELTTQVAGAITGPTLTANATKVVLDTQYQEVGSPPSSVTTGGLVLAAGRHTATVSVQLQENDGSATTIGSLRVRKGPGPGHTVAVFAITTAYSVGDFVRPTNANRNGRTYRCTTAGTSGGAEPAWGTTNGGTTASGTATFTETTVKARLLKSNDGYTYTKMHKEVAFDADGTTAYELTVLYSAATAANRKIHVLRLTHSTLRSVDDGYALQMLGDLEVLQTANGAVAVDDLVKRGPFITLGSGTSALWVDLWSSPPLAYDDLDPRDPLARQDPTLTTTLAVDVIPRYWS